jgi:putative ABC transport system substrate-binding protein
MRRRVFLTLLAGATAWPCATRAQQSAPIVGYLSALSEAQVVPQLDGFRRGLNQMGFAEGRNVAIEYRWAEGQYERLPEMAAELVGRPVSLILAQAPPAAIAAKRATATIPIVFVVGFDPVEARLVSSLNNPGGNATGATLTSVALGQKRLEMLREISKAAVIAMLVNPLSPDSRAELPFVQAGAQALRLQLAVFNASTPSEIDAAFAMIAARRADALLVGSDPFFLNQRTDIVARAARLGIPAIYPFRDFATAGGVISYGTKIAGTSKLASTRDASSRVQAPRSSRSSSRPSSTW